VSAKTSIEEIVSLLIAISMDSGGVLMPRLGDLEPPSDDEDDILHARLNAEALAAVALTVFIEADGKEVPLVRLSHGKQFHRALGKLIFHLYRDRHQLREAIGDESYDAVSTMLHFPFMKRMKPRPDGREPNYGAWFLGLVVLSSIAWALFTPRG